jgi:hypothetical protein
MKITCDVVKDIIPLYVENMCSEDSRNIVEEHISKCEDCKNYLDEMKKMNTISADININPLLKIRSTLRKKKIHAIILTTMVSLMFFVIMVVFLTEPEYIPYSEEAITINEQGDASVLALFGEGVSGYDINSHQTDDNKGYVYHITTWNTLLNRMTDELQANNTVLNPNGENIIAIYYYEPDGSEDELIYGSDMHLNGGVVTLPRLFLAYYAQIAVVFGIICGMIMLLFRRQKKVFKVAMRLFFIPVSYIIGYFIIKGSSSATYTPIRDLSAILLLTIPLYTTFITIIRLIINSRKVQS